MSETPRDGSHDEERHGPGALTVVLVSLAIFVIGCVLVIAFAIR